MTDFLANGDTDYPVLQGAQPGPDERLSQQVFWPLNLAINQFLTATDHTPPFHGQDTVDCLTMTVAKPPASNGFRDWWSNLMKVDQFHWNCPANPTPGNPASTPADCLERGAQDNPRWTLTLYKLDGTIRCFSTTAYDYILRAERDWSHFFFFTDSSLNYIAHQQRTASPSNNYQASQTADFWFAEGGFGCRLYPRHQNPSGLKLQVAPRFQMPLWSPLVSLSPLLPPGVMGGGGSSSPQVVHERPKYYSLRPSIRYEYVHP